MIQMPHGTPLTTCIMNQGTIIAGHFMEEQFSAIYHVYPAS